MYSLERTNELITYISQVFDEMFIKRGTVQSQLFPTTEYIIVACSNSYERFYSQLLPVAQKISPEEIGSKHRYLFSEITPLQIYNIVMFPLFGRFARIRTRYQCDPFNEPMEKYQEMQFIIDFWKRLAQTYYGGPLTVHEMEGQCRILDENQLKKIKNIMSSTSRGEIKEIKKVAANLQLLSFMDECETRMRISSHGPYPHEGHDLVITEMIRLFTGNNATWPWSATTATAPYSNIAFVYELKEMKKIWFNDWGTMFTDPIDYSKNITQVALLGQNKGDSKFAVLNMKELKEFNDYAEQALTELYLKMARWSRAQKMEGGFKTYTENFRRFTDLVGVSEAIDWSMSPNVRENEFTDLVNKVGRRYWQPLMWILRPKKQREKQPTFIPRWK